LCWHLRRPGVFLACHLEALGQVLRWTRCTLPRSAGLDRG
jgi:hypothetical protein